MIDAGRSNNHQKSCMSIAYETYKDFAENTSIHGLKYTVKTGIAIYERIFWILIVISGLVGAGYMTVLFWSRFTSNPTRTSIQTDFAPTTSVPFPAVTICNINRIMANKVDAFVQRLTIPEDQVDIVERALPQLLAFTNPSALPYNMTELDILHQVLVQNDYVHIVNIMRRVTQSCDELLIKCQWNFDVYACPQLFQESFTTDGLCCSFNYIRSDYSSSQALQKEEIYSPFNGFDSGLVLLVDSMPQKVQYSSIHSTGIKVIIHSPDDYPGSGALYKIISVGRQSLLQISATRINCSENIRQLSLEQRQCAYSEEVSLRYFPQYEDTNCITENEAMYYWKECGCVPFYFYFIADKPTCNISQIDCLHQSKMRTVRKNSKNMVSFIDNCPSQCEDEFYNVFSTTTKYDKNNSFVASSFQIGENLTDDTIYLMIYFTKQTHTILYKDTITSTTYLLSSFGGVYSLFLGCSFITIIEIAYYCLFRLVVNLKMRDRIDHQPPSLTVHRNAWQKDVPVKLWRNQNNAFLH